MMSHAPVLLKCAEMRLLRLEVFWIVEVSFANLTPSQKDDRHDMTNTMGPNGFLGILCKTKKIPFSLLKYAQSYPKKIAPKYLQNLFDNMNTAAFFP
jgi:hypothetical protein